MNLVFKIRSAFKLISESQLYCASESMGQILATKLKAAIGLLSSEEQTRIHLSWIHFALTVAKKPSNPILFLPVLTNKLLKLISANIGHRSLTKFFAPSSPRSH